MSFSICKRISFCYRDHFCGSLKSIARYVNLERFFYSPMKAKSYTALLRLWVGILRYRNIARLLKMYIKILGNTMDPEMGGGGKGICTKFLYDNVILLEMT